MIKLQERLPDSVTVRGKRYKLKPDFRNVLMMMETMDNPEIIPEARTYQALRHVIRHVPKDDTLCAEIMAEVRKTLFPEAKKKESGKKLTSFVQDADLIRGAFRQVYGIDLFRDPVHWVEFSCLLSCLPEGSRYSDIIGIRAKPLPEPTKWNRKEREALMRAKQECRLILDDKEVEQGVQDTISGIAHFLMSVAKGSDKHNAS
jgi:hypothetical protein